MPIIKDRILPYMRSKLLYFLKDFFVLYTLAILSLKSVIFMGFIGNGNPSKFSLGKGFDLVYHPSYFFSFILIFLSFSFIFKGRKRAWFLYSLNIVITVVFLFDLWYFRAFGSFISPYLLSQTANLENLSDSIFSMMSPWDCILIIDLLIPPVLLIMFKSFNRDRKRHLVLFAVLFVLSTGFVLYVPFKVNVLGKKDGMSYIYQVPWRPELSVYRLSPTGYHLFDIFTYFKDSRRLVLNPGEVAEIKAWFKDKNENLPDNKYKAMLKGKNLIFIQVESMENFVIGQKINNQEITPSMNRLLKNSIYFSSIDEQVHLGTSSDSDLLVNTSVYPVRNGSTFFRYPNNTYNSLPKLLEKSGYSTLAIHPDKGAFWNWMPALKSIGFQRCIDASAFKLDEFIGLGLSDGSYLRQVKPIITIQKQPFYVFMVTMTSHAPFKIPKNYQELALPKNISDTRLGDYFQSVRYTDTQIGLFLSELENAGILDNTVIAICGDHCGVHKYYTPDILKIKPKENWWTYNNNYVPLIIYQKSLEGTKLNVTGGQVDILPTISYLMGVDEKEYADTAMGRNLLKTKKDFSVLSDGTYKSLISIPKEREAAIKGLEIADKIIRSDFFKKYK